MDPENVAEMARFGINPQGTLGVEQASGLQCRHPCRHARKLRENE